MGRRGPAPKPTAMKELAGNPGKRALNRGEPQFSLETKIPPCPKHLVPDARKEWRRVSSELVRIELMTVVDRSALAAYCQAYARWVEAEREMAKPDFVMVETTDKGYAHVNPWFQVATQAMKQMKAFASEFGLTPASRSRIDMGQASEDDDFTAFLQRRNDSSKPG